MFPVNDLTVLIVTFKTNHKILDDCIKSIEGKSKIIIVENSKDEEFKKEYEILSKLITLKFFFNNSSIKLLPIKPSPPVTIIFFFILKNQLFLY